VYSLKGRQQHSADVRLAGLPTYWGGGCNTPSTLTQQEQTIMTRRQYLRAVALLGAVACGIAAAALGDPLRPVLTLANYPAHTVTATPEHTSAMRESATALVREARRGAAVWVLVVGHADFDSKGREFEFAISLARGSSAANDYRALFDEQADAAGLNLAQRQRVTFDVVGAGTQQPAVRRPISESDRRLNRRVEILWFDDGASVQSLRSRLAAR
jgi:hypothetical protein